MTSKHFIIGFRPISLSMTEDSSTGFNQSNILIFKINVLHINMDIKDRLYSV